MPTMTKAAIVATICEKTGHHRVDIKEYVDDLLEVMVKTLKKDRSLLFSGFGKFEVMEKKPRKGRNPQTAQAIILSARKVATFRLSRKFRTALNS